MEYHYHSRHWCEGYALCQSVSWEIHMNSGRKKCLLLKQIPVTTMSTVGRFGVFLKSWYVALNALEYIHNLTRNVLVFHSSLLTSV